MDAYNIIHDHLHNLYPVPFHEVLISFNNDEDALLFIEWFTHHREAFEDYVDGRCDIGG